MSASAPASSTAAKVDVGRAIKDAVITALIAFALFLPLIGFKTVQNIRNELELETRMPLLLTLVAIIAGAKLLYALVIAPWREQRALAPRAENPALARAKSALTTWFTPFFLGFVVIYPVIVMLTVGPQGALKWVDNFGIQILIY